MLLAEDEIDQKEARKLMSKQLPFSRNTINNVLREKALYGNVLGGAAPKSRLRRFDKLSDEQKEDIRKLVNSSIYGLSSTVVFKKKIIHQFITNQEFWIKSNQFTSAQNNRITIVKK